MTKKESRKRKGTGVVLDKNSDVEVFGRHAGRQQGTFIKKTPFELEKKKKDTIVVKTVSIVFSDSDNENCNPRLL